MISIISGSNRDGNLTSFFSAKCFQILEGLGEQVQLLSLEDLPSPISLSSVYDYGNTPFNQLSKTFIQPVSKILFVVPEYNGSIPGVLKLLIDAIEPKDFKGKKAALIGVAAGRAGNLRGMDHLTDILHHLEVQVMPQKLPISQMYGLLKNAEVVDEATISLLQKQMKLLVDF